jgi:hypothetical protein
MSTKNALNKIIPIQESLAIPVAIPESIPESIPVSTVCCEHKLTTFILEGLGWTGSILVLCPYVMTLERDLDFILNTLGATGLLIVCITSKQYQSIVINSAWIIGGIYKYYANK